MIYRFKKNGIYGGEELHGGCGFMERHKIMVLKRTKGYVIYKSEFTDRIFKARREYYSGWGDSIMVPLHESEQYHAYCVEPGVEPFEIKAKLLRRYKKFFRK